MIKNDLNGGSDDLFRLMFDKSSAVMLLINPKSGKIIYANPAATSFYGWSYEEIVEKNISEINTLSPEQVKIEMNNAETEKRNYFLFKHRLANGTVRDVEVNSSPVNTQNEVMLFSIVHDVTQKNIAEKLSRENNEELEKINTSLLDRELKMFNLNYQLQELNSSKKD